MAISLENLTKLQWCSVNPNNTLQDINSTTFNKLYSEGWSSRPNLPPTIPLTDTINFVLDKKSNFAVKQLEALLKAQGVAVTDVDKIPNTALKDSIDGIAKKSAEVIIVQALGTATNKTISQKVVSDNLNKKLNKGDFGVGQDLTSYTRDDYGIDANKYVNNGFYGLSSSAVKLENNFPISTGDGSLLVFGDYHNKVQIFNGTANRLFWRMNNTNNTTSWEEWGEFYHDKNTTKDANGFLRASGTKTTLTTDKLTSTLGTSTTLAATQKLVNDVKTDLSKDITNNKNDSFNKMGSLGTKDLDALNSTNHVGIYHQTANANATPERHYPAKLAGTLFVTEAAGITQIYIVYNGANDIYTRNNYGGSWSTWDKKLNSKDVTSALGTSTTLVSSQKLANDVNTKAVNAQTKADQAHTLASNAIPNSKKTSALGTSTDLVATQKLVNDVSVRTTNAQTKADQAHTLATTANNTANSAQSTANTAKSTADQALSKANAGSGLGYGQKWFDVTSERALGTTYTNNTNKPIEIHLKNSASNAAGKLYIDGLDMFDLTPTQSIISVIVPPNSKYKVQKSGTYSPNMTWRELR